MPIPESVFVALHGVQEAVADLGRGLNQKIDTNQAATDLKFSSIKDDVARIEARDKAHIAKIVGIVATAVATVIGGQRVLAPAPVAPEVRAVRSSADLALDECRPLRAGSYERAECFERVSRGPGQPH